MNKYFYSALIIFASISFFSLGWMSHSAYVPVKKVKKITLLERIKRDKQLNVLFLNSSTVYYIGAEGPQGFEYDLLSSYAKHLGVSLHITEAHTIKEALTLNQNLDIHITSAGVVKTALKEKVLNFGPSYFEIQEQMICNRGMQAKHTFPKDVEDLSGLKIMVGDKTSYKETLLTLINDGFDINVTYTSEFSSVELLEKVSKHEIDCTVTASNIYALNLRYFPEVAMAFTVSNREQLAWVLPPNENELESDMYTWLNDFNQQGKMTQLKDHYYSYVLFFDYYNTKMFYKRIESRLPKYKQLFQEAATRFSIPWTLLAAISYQESHWNAKAKSHTGVRGLMMLTRHTAKLLKVTNRLDPKQSIVGGTRHIKQMLKFVKPEVEGENRLKFALAAYNIGWGHVRDAQKLALEIGLNPNIWSDLKIVLPLLEQKKYYRSLEYGYARGREPVNYVESIYNYRDILEKQLKTKESAKAPQ